MVNLLSNDVDQFIDAFILKFRFENSNFTSISDVKKRHIFRNCQVTHLCEVVT
jgi:hypothetical protein